jgi:hypothetical protein
MHHLRTSGKLNAALAAELHEILEEIPAHEYLHDLHCLREALDAAEGGTGQAGASKLRPAGKRKAA